MTGHAAYNLIRAGLVRGCEGNRFCLARLHFDLPVNIWLVLFVEMFTHFCAIFHDNEIMFHGAIMLHMKCDLLTCRNDILIRCECEVGHVDMDIGGWLILYATGA